MVVTRRTETVRDSPTPAGSVNCRSEEFRMTSQLQHLLLPLSSPATTGLLSSLRRRNPEAERLALVEHNATLPPAECVPLPPAAAGYAGYATAHLALLWRHIRNLEALRMVAERHRLSLRLPAESLATVAAVVAFYRTMPRELLRYLWVTVGDADAYRELLRLG